MLREIAPQAEQVFRDQYVMEFIGGKKYKHENNMKAALIKQMKDFILELQYYCRAFDSNVKEKTILLPHVAVKIPTCGKKLFLTCPLHLPVWVRSFISVIVDVDVDVERLAFSELFSILCHSRIKSDRTDSSCIF